MNGLIIKKNANLFTVYSEDNFYNLAARGNLKKQGLFVGDNVEFDKVIDKICARKNLLIRPPLANLDKLFIVVAPIPKPDFLLVDKMLVYCYTNGIEPIIVVNKSDIASSQFLSEIDEIYSKVTKIIKISTKKGELTALKDQIQGICTLAGQSAVGKSSIINSLLGSRVCEVGDLSTKVQRGKQTTRLVELFKFGDGFLADTAGFSMLDLAYVVDLQPRELSTYYPDFLEFRAFCKFSSCLHASRDKCGIIEGVKNGEISKVRYQNYLKLLQQLKEAQKF